MQPDRAGIKRFRPYRAEMWVIPNGAGSLWTANLFDSEAEAKAYVYAYWREQGWEAGTEHKPVLARVEIRSAALATRSNADAG